MCVYICFVYWAMCFAIVEKWHIKKIIIIIIIIIHITENSEILKIQAKWTWAPTKGVTNLEICIRGTPP